jgi:replicative DNA helicase Mcm
VRKGQIVPGAPGKESSIEYPSKDLYRLYSKLLTSIKCPRPATPDPQEISLLVESCKKNAPKKREKGYMRILEDVLKISKLSWHKIQKVSVQPNNGIEWVYDITIEPTRRFVSNNVILHNTVSIAKAGIVARLNARAAVIAAGNPKYGRYIEDRLLADNINLPVTILSRFDLILILKDKPEALYDASLARHVLTVHRDTEKIRPEIPLDILKKYISYARRYVRPRLTEQASDMLKNFFVEMRRMGAESPERVVTITARQLEALVRLAEAHARMALKNEVTEEDAAEAIRLMRVFLEQVGMETETGAIDIDAIMVGKPKSRREKMMIIDDAIREIISETGEECAPLKAITEKVKREGIQVSELEDLLRRMHKEGLIFERRPGCYSRIS